MAMLSFRAKPSLLQTIDRTQHEAGLKDRSAAVRYLLWHGAEAHAARMTAKAARETGAGRAWFKPRTWFRRRA